MAVQQSDSGLVPKQGQDSFLAGEGLEGINTLVSLEFGTCTHRAASEYRRLHQDAGRNLRIKTVSNFERAILAVRDNPQAMLLIPKLHQLQQILNHKGHYQQISSQGFTLPNPPLHVATPNQNTSSRTYLWALPNLVPLVEEQYRDGLPFEEVVSTESTRQAAELCGQIFGGGFCVTNASGMQLFNLRPVKKLRQLLMEWFLYRKQKNKLSAW